MTENPFIQSDQILPEDQDLEIVELTAVPYPDKRRISVKFRLSSFMSPPNAAVTIKNQQGEQLSAVKIVNIFHLENEITLHLPAGKNPPGDYTVDLSVFSLIEEKKDGEDDQVVSLKEKNITSGSCPLTIQ